MIRTERKQGSTGPLHRFVCGECGRVGTWLNTESVAARNGAIHAEYHNAERDVRVLDEDLELAQAALQAPRGDR